MPDQVKDKPTLKERILSQFPSLKDFADLLGCPVATVRSWTRPTDPRIPKEWISNAYLDAATLRGKSVTGWKCGHCENIRTDSGPGVAPKFCAVCGSAGSQTPVSVIAMEVRSNG